jgi:hypothetical protein
MRKRHTLSCPLNIEDSSFHFVTFLGTTHADARPEKSGGEFVGGRIVASECEDKRENARNIASIKGGCQKITEVRDKEIKFYHCP